MFPRRIGQKPGSRVLEARKKQTHQFTGPGATVKGRKDKTKKHRTGGKVRPSSLKKKKRR